MVSHSGPQPQRHRGQHAKIGNPCLVIVFVSPRSDTDHTNLRVWLPNRRCPLRRDPSAPRWINAGVCSGGRSCHCLW